MYRVLRYLLGRKSAIRAQIIITRTTRRRGEKLTEQEVLVVVFVISIVGACR